MKYTFKAAKKEDFVNSILEKSVACYCLYYPEIDNNKENTCKQPCQWIPQADNCKPSRIYGNSGNDSSGGEFNNSACERNCSMSHTLDTAAENTEDSKKNTCNTNDFHKNIYVSNKHFGIFGDK